MRPTALGFDFIGVEGMPESRSTSREVELLRELLRSAEVFVDVRGQLQPVQIERGLRENFSGGINRRFMDVFERFWGFGYECCTAETERHPVRRVDVQRWISKGERDFGDMNYLFQKTGS